MRAVVVYESILLRAHEFDMVAKPESFLVTRQNQLDPGETTRARDWAAKLAASVRPDPMPNGAGK